MHVRIPARQLEIPSSHFLGIQMQGRFEDHGLGYLRTLSLVILLCITSIQVNIQAQRNGWDSCCWDSFEETSSLMFNSE